MEDNGDKTISDLKMLMDDFENMISEATISDYYFGKGNMDPQTTRALIVYDMGQGKIDMSRMEMLDNESKAMIAAAALVALVLSQNPCGPGCVRRHSCARWHAAAAAAKRSTPQRRRGGDECSGGGGKLLPCGGFQ